MCSRVRDLASFRTPRKGHARSETSSIEMVLSLTCAVQNYDWGIKGGCEVSALGELNTGVDSDPSKPYAELWMGTHPSGPSVVSATGVGLKETIAADPAAHLGAKTVERFGDDLPFLTKVLSVAKALSIQAHPDKTLAAQLHADRPNVYKDANHKPEMTLAVTEFEALCGFVAGDELAANLRAVPELRAVVGDVVAADFENSTGNKDELAKVFTALMTADSDAVAAQVDTLAARLKQKDDKTKTPVDHLAQRLNDAVPAGRRRAVRVRAKLPHLETRPVHLPRRERTARVPRGRVRGVHGHERQRGTRGTHTKATGHRHPVRHADVQRGCARGAGRRVPWMRTPRGTCRRSTSSCSRS